MIKSLVWENQCARCPSFQLKPVLLCTPFPYSTLCRSAQFQYVISIPPSKKSLFLISHAFERRYFWLVSCCWKLRTVKGRKNGGVFVSAAVAAVHFSPELLSEKPVTSLMINVCAHWAVLELQQPLKPDSLSPATLNVQPQPVLQHCGSMPVFTYSGQRIQLVHGK